MRLSYLVIIILSLALVRCASTPEAAPPPSGAEIPDAEVSSVDEGVTSDTEFNANEAVVQSAEPESPTPAPEAAPQNQVTETTPSEVQNQPSPTMSEHQGPVATSDNPATITALDFNAAENGGTVVVRTSQEVAYTTRKNEKNNQFVIELENTKVPKRFQRPYNTKEFPGAIASINAYQGKGSNTAKIVVQLRDVANPGVSQMGKTISISAAGESSMTASSGGSNPNQGSSAENSSSTEPENTANQETPASGGSDEQVDAYKIMNNKSFDNFLLGQNKFYGRPISIEVTNQDVREVFKFISEESGLNIVLDDDVSGKTTMKLKKVPWDQALAILLQSKQLGYVRNGSILRIASLKTLTTESTSARQVMDAQKNLQSLRVQVYPVSYAKANDMATQVRELLSPGRGKVTSDARTNTLVVTDIPEVLSKVRALVTKLDTQTPQVLIEAKIVEARDTFQKSFGVNWGATGGSTTTLPIAVNNRGNDITVGSNATTNAQTSLSFTPSSATNALALTVGNLDILGDLNTTLKFLETQGTVKVISSPRIVALDRVQASIEQTTQLPNFSSTTNSTTGFTATSISFQDFRLALKVTPQITVEGGIIMDVDVTREFPGTQEGAVGTATSYPSNKRHASTQILVENGETAVIGGIYQSDITIGENGVPWLRKLPLIGWLFGAKSTTKEKNELVIFLSPRILNKEKAFVKADEAM